MTLSPAIDDSCPAQPDPEAIMARLDLELGRYRSLIIAFSGGVDSAVLLAAARRILGDRAVALTADSPSMPRAELEAAQELAASLGVCHIVAQTSELERPEYVSNDRQRCYWCKTTLFETCQRFSRDLGIDHVAYGYTADDVGDYRPGHAAAAEFRVRAPLYDAGLGKKEIRAAALLMNLKVWDKPAAPCLSSRIPYGSEVSIQKLSTIEAMEAMLHELGFPIVRARFDGTTMKVEVPNADIPRLNASDIWSQVNGKAQELSVPLLVIDPEGFRSGKLNGVGVGA